MKLSSNTIEELSRFFSWGLFLVVIVGAFVFAGPTNLGGPASYVIVDGTSMEPTYHDGDLVIAYEHDSYEVGDVIVYDAPVDSQFNVIHRITERTQGGFITQGDNRDEVDGWIAPDEQIFGASALHIPKGGDIVGFLRQPAALFALVAFWGALEFFKRQEKKSACQDRETIEQSAESVT